MSAMIQLMDITTANKVPFRVFFLPAGDTGLLGGGRYGDKTAQPCVEFYDRRNQKTAHGEQVGGRYTADGLIERHHPGTGLELDGSWPEWFIDGRSFDAIIEWLKIVVYRS